MASLERIVISGGGTAGHVYPGVAVAEEILRRNPAARILFIGSGCGLESTLLRRLGYRFERIAIRPIRLGNLRERIQALRLVPGAIRQSRKIIRRFNPQIVLGTGGFPSGPALVAAWSMRLPVAIHEQNAVPGLANRWLRPFANAVFLGIASAREHFPHNVTYYTGNPLTPSLVEALTAVAAARTAPAPGTLGIIVLGGSLGAVFLNRHIPRALATYRRHRPDVGFRVLHQAGVAHVDETRRAYLDAGLDDAVTVTGFIDDRTSAYGAADIAISRAGALTIADLSTAALPSLLVPLAAAADNHQVANARFAEQGGGAIVQLEDAWCDDALTARLNDITGDAGRLSRMAACQRAMAPTGAAMAVVDRLEEMAARARSRRIAGPDEVTALSYP